MKQVCDSAAAGADLLIKRWHSHAQFEMKRARAAMAIAEKVVVAVAPSGVDSVSGCSPAFLLSNSWGSYSSPVCSYDFFPRGGWCTSALVMGFSEPS